MDFLIPAKLRGLWGYVSSSTFEFVIKPSFASAYCFTDDELALVTYNPSDVSDNNSEVLDGGRADVAGRVLPLHVKRGYIDKTGSLKIATPFSDAYGFYQGRACVATGISYGWIGVNGSFDVDPTFNCAKPFSNGYASVRGVAKDGHEKWGIIDSKGNLIFPFSYDYIGRQSEGKISFQDNDGKWGYMNSFFLKSIEPKFEWGGYFSEWVAAVKYCGYWGFVNHLGDFVIEPQYENAFPFKGGLARICLDGKWGFINHNNEIVVPFIFDDATDFMHSVAGVQYEDKWGFISRKFLENQSFVCNPTFEGIRS